jgi:hypothetical protein
MFGVPTSCFDPIGLNGDKFQPDGSFLCTFLFCSKKYIAINLAYCSWRQHHVIPRGGIQYHPIELSSHFPFGAFLQLFSTALLC